MRLVEAVLIRAILGLQVGALSRDIELKVGGTGVGQNKTGGML